VRGPPLFQAIKFLGYDAILLRWATKGSGGKGKLTFGINERFLHLESPLG